VTPETALWVVRKASSAAELVLSTLDCMTGHQYWLRRCNPVL